MEPTVNDGQSCRYTDDTIKRKYVAKLLHPVKQNGFQSLRMDDIAKIMDLSKATLYKYFPSRDEVICYLTRILVQYVIGPESQYGAGSFESCVQGFQASFAQSLMIANYGTEVFFQDLREVYPQLMAEVEMAIGERNDRLRHFYETGMQAGFMNDTNASLIILQDELMFNKLMDPHYLMKHNLTLRGAVGDYYRIKKLQVFKPERYPQIHDEGMAERIEQLVRKVMYGAY